MIRIIWNDEPGENVEKVEQHGLSVDDVEYVLANPESETVSRSTGRPCVFGYTEDDRYILVIFERLDELTIYPITAYEVEP